MKKSPKICKILRAASSKSSQFGSTSPSFSQNLCCSGFAKGSYSIGPAVVKFLLNFYPNFRIMFLTFCSRSTFLSPSLFLVNDGSVDA